MRARLKQFRSYITRQLRALAQPTCVLLLAMCCVFVEPLAYNMRCQMPDVWQLRHQPAAAPNAATIAFSSTNITFAAFSSEILGVPVNPDCFHVFSDSSFPTLAAPSIHDIVLVALPMLASLVLFQRLDARPPALLRSCDPTPPTPPPRHRTA